jgi:hypothetical protein
MMAAVLRTVAVARAAQARNQYVAQADALAVDLMTEITDKHYSDPDQSPVFGCESGEAASGRSGFDDVDDYDGLSESPPRDRANNAMTNLSGWSRQVEVAWVSPTNPTNRSVSETGVKVVIVTVTRSQKRLAQLTALRTRASTR